MSTEPQLSLGAPSEKQVRLIDGEGHYVHVD
jgi:hypothetical protein